MTDQPTDDTPTAAELDDAISSSEAEALSLERRTAALDTASRVLGLLVEGILRATPHLLAGLTGDAKADGGRVADGILRGLRRHNGPLPDPDAATP